MRHRKTIRHFHEPGHLHELTFSCYQRKPLLVDDTLRRHLARCLDEACRIEQVELVAFVFMPEHVHLIIYPSTAVQSIGRFLARTKQPFSKLAKGFLAEQESPWLQKLHVRERPGKTCFRFWQEGAGFDRNLFSQSAILASLDYVHMNPIRRGLVERAVDWKWSSASLYLNEPHGQRDADLPCTSGIPAGTCK